MVAYVWVDGKDITKKERNKMLKKHKKKKAKVLRKKLCIVCNEYKKIAQAEKNRCLECLNAYNPMFSFSYLLPYI